MPKLTKTAVDALLAKASSDAFLWDSELRGFSVGLKPSGTKTFVIQYRNAERRTRWFVIGQYGVLSVEVARNLAKKKLASVIDGGVDLSRFCSGQVLMLGGLAFEGHGAFPAQG